MQQQFWLKKKVVQRRLGSKEDECVISSDSELDSKLQIFKAITITNFKLAKIIEDYNDRLYYLSQEKNDFGRFMCEAGKRSRTTSRCITKFGKTIQFCGQQIMCTRVPLLRLHHEVTIFKECAVSDTQSTVTSMENGRTEYRAALEWMKSLCESLDPDTGRGLHKYRAVQGHVRLTKSYFDSMALDCVQKIDLLSAARCNMFSHALVAYIAELKENAEKTIDALNLIVGLTNQELLSKVDDYYDPRNSQTNENIEATSPTKTAQDIAAQVTELEDAQKVHSETLLISLTESNEQQINRIDKTRKQQSSPSLSLIDGLNAICFNIDNQYQQNFTNGIDKLLSNDFESDSGIKSIPPPQIPQRQHSQNTSLVDLKSKYDWMQLFSELDPLTNLEEFNKTIRGLDSTSQHT